MKLLWIFLVWIAVAMLSIAGCDDDSDTDGNGNCSGFCSSLASEDCLYEDQTEQECVEICTGWRTNIYCGDEYGDWVDCVAENTIECIDTENGSFAIAEACDTETSVYIECMADMTDS